MAKDFLTYDQQVDKLVNEKGLAVPDRGYAIETLKRTSYFAPVNGYKQPLRDPMTRRYKPGTEFSDIVALFEFDARLRGLFMEAIVRVERKLRSSISYAFCSREGSAQERYLDPASYSDARKHRGGVARLVKIMEGIAVRNDEYPYIVHQRSKYGNVPLWAVVNAMTFGQTSRMYAYLRHPMRADVAKQYEHVNERELGQHLKVLVLYRNCCAHGERLFSHKVYSDVPDTPLHAKLGIPKNGDQYAMGKRDLFGAVISLRYLLPPDQFLPFRRQLARLVDGFARDCAAIEADELLDLMGFPKNWADLTRYGL